MGISMPTVQSSGRFSSLMLHATANLTVARLSALMAATHPPLQQSMPTSIVLTGREVCTGPIHGTAVGKHLWHGARGHCYNPGRMTDSEDPYREARSRAINALKPLTWEAFRAAAAAWIGGTLAFATATTVMVAAKMLSIPLAWNLSLAAAISSALGAFGFLYIGRLKEQAAALRDLLAAHRQYEILLRAAWDERDQATNTARSLMIEVDAMRRVIVGASIVRHLEDKP